jgi:hypothetical protein
MILKPRNAWSALALGTPLLVLLTAILPPANTRTRAKPVRITSRNNLNHFVASLPCWAVDQSNRLATLTSDGSAMKSATTSGEKIATNRLATPDSHE